MRIFCFVFCCLLVDNFFKQNKKHLPHPIYLIAMDPFMLEDSFVSLNSRVSMDAVIFGVSGSIDRLGIINGSVGTKWINGFIVLIDALLSSNWCQMPMD